MADTVTTKTVYEDNTQLKVHVTGLSDGTGESNVIKVTKSSLVSSSGIAPVSLDLMEARWSSQGYTYLKFMWNHASRETALLLSGNGYDFFGDSPGLQDGRGAGGTGDIELTTVGAVSGATYDVTLTLKKRNT